MPRQASSAARPLTDHEEIRNWAEDRGGKPSCVRGTGGESDVGMIRIDFPGYSGEGSLEEISWDEWFDKFDERNLALLVQDETAAGETSNFNKLVSRGTARGGRSRARGTTRARGTNRAEGRSKRQKSAAARGRSSSTSGRSSSRGTSRARRRSTPASRSEARGRSSRAQGRRSNRSTQVRRKKVNGSAQRSSRRKAA
jgi:hypothetical protein